MITSSDPIGQKEAEAMFNMIDSEPRLWNMLNRLGQFMFRDYVGAGHTQFIPINTNSVEHRKAWAWAYVLSESHHGE